MNLQELIAAFRTDAFDKKSPYFWTDCDVIRWFNEAEQEACIRQKLIREKTNPAICRIDVTAENTVYPLDPRVIDINYASMVYVGNDNMFPYILAKTTTDELDMIRPQWRALSYRPRAIICYDTSIETDCIPDTAYTINLEVYRLPLQDMVNSADTPEINAIHHRHLVKWVLFRAAQMQDAEIESSGRAEKFEAQFDEYFGRRPTADNRRRQNANRPHRNVAVW